jgi:hypothetical protein
MNEAGVPAYVAMIKPTAQIIVVAATIWKAPFSFENSKCGQFPASGRHG